MPRHFLLFVDEARPDAVPASKAIEALRDFVTRFDPSDEAILVAERSVPSRSPTGLRGAKRSSPRSTRHFAERRGGAPPRRTRAPGDARDPHGGARRRAGERARMYEEEVYEEDEEDPGGHDEHARAPRRQTGKKIFLDISGGFELQPGAALLNFAGRGGSSSLSFRRDVTPELQRFIDRRPTRSKRRCSPSMRAGFRGRRPTRATEVPPVHDLAHRASGHAGRPRRNGGADRQGGHPSDQRSGRCPLRGLSRRLLLLFSRREPAERDGHGVASRSRSRSTGRA